ncbi:putative palmitoyltransferase ZDHHC6-like [Tropilaelaps mercedesae]|uniref:Palmitoyltransferase n=1 Tax=Tropilaelaps mercedesae TaxID=418985 RepID=A0A1V9Y043_9ACAR|nr:putative palmitoyltransferase ZDHHC6-like [Tropilaelaps mercedesae]
MTTLTMNAERHKSESGSIATLGHRLLHWGPLAAMAIIKFVFFTCVYLTSWWWPPYDTVGGTINYVMYMVAVGLILYNFLCSVGAGAGFVPKGWRPKDPKAEELLQYCALCEGFKPPRAHHCRRCRRCVMKMDHHCPWINTCVGHRNHRNFIAFLLFCVTGSIHSIILLGCGLHKAYNVRWYEDMEAVYVHKLRSRGLVYPPPGYQPPPLVYVSFEVIIAVVLSIGLALGVIISLGSLLYFQLKIVIRNETGIEAWINQKAEMRLEEMSKSPKEWKYPYDLGWKENIRMVLAWWVPDGDGIEWPVREGCNQYTLTVEQKVQKDDKRLRRRPYVVTRTYYGGYFPWCGHGCCACIRTPLNDEPRLRLQIGQMILVTRWKRYWLYGELTPATLGKTSPFAVSSTTQSPYNGNPLDPPKGWFPRSCAVQCVRPQPIKKIQ